MRRLQFESQSPLKLQLQLRLKSHSGLTTPPGRLRPVVRPLGADESEMASESKNNHPQSQTTG